MEIWLCCLGLFLAQGEFAEGYPTKTVNLLNMIALLRSFVGFGDICTCNSEYPHLKYLIIFHRYYVCIRILRGNFLAQNLVDSASSARIAAWHPPTSNFTPQKFNIDTQNYHI